VGEGAPDFAASVHPSASLSRFRVPFGNLRAFISEMTTRNMDDWQLLQQYARNRSEGAFAELVRLHLDWVYSVALRHVSDPHLAEDVAQSVFVLLARKGGDLRPGTLLGGWLFRTTCHVAAHARRTEQRRKIRETTASTMSPDTHSPDATELLWQRLAPHLDQAVAALSTDDRAAILMRFYEKMPLRKVGERLGVSEDAAKKRVSRAVDRVREYLGRRGVRVGGVVLGTALAERTVQAASAALAGTVVKLSLAAASASTSAMLPQLARETLRAWRWARLKLAAGVAAGSLMLAFVAVNAGGLFKHHSAPPSAMAIDLPDANVATIPQAQDQNTSPVPRANRRSSLPPKTGALTGLVVDELGQPVAGALVWGGFSSRPFAQDKRGKEG
jgi:RNA polymerase sigma factor (sigma-70 family)